MVDTQILWLEEKFNCKVGLFQTVDSVHCSFSIFSFLVASHSIHVQKKYLLRDVEIKLKMRNGVCFKQEVIVSMGTTIRIRLLSQE
jgi:hypothetical protein